jgi:hypothetical protein
MQNLIEKQTFEVNLLKKCESFGKKWLYWLRNELFTSVADGFFTAICLKNVIWITFYLKFYLLLVVCGNERGYICTAFGIILKNCKRTSRKMDTAQVIDGLE